MSARAHRASQQRDDRAGSSDTRLGLLLVGAAVLLWFLYRDFADTNRTLAARPRQLALFGAAFLVFLTATLAVWRARSPVATRWTLFIIAAGLLFRATVAPARPATTSDIYRYLWEGRVVRAGVNPYSHAPGDPELVPLRNWVWPLVQHKSVPAAYPPVAQYVFLLAGLLPPNPILGLKLVLALFDGLSVLLLADVLRRLQRPPAWVICYAWHPLAVCEIVARGHVDSVGIFFLVLAARLLLVSSRRGRILSGLALALSVLSKGYALVTVPFLVSAAKPHRRAYLLAFGLAGLVASLPFASAGAGLFSGLRAYAERWHGNASVFTLASIALAPLTGNPDRLARIACALGLAGWLVFLLFRGRPTETPEKALRLCQQAMQGLFLVAATVYPWYLAWTVPFLCLTRSLPWLLLTGTIFGFYAHDFAGHHREIWWVTSLEYGPPLALALWLRLRASPRRFGAQ